MKELRLKKNMIIEGIEIEKESHSCFKIKAGGKVAYFDPYKIKNPEKADIILITHEHFDHLSLEDVEKVFKEDTVVVIAPISHPPLLQLEKDINHLVVMGPQEKYHGEGFEVETILAYNIDKFRKPGKVYHPKEDERVGFVLAIAGKRIYHAGDTDFIPEIEGLKNIDIAFLPVSGAYVMTAKEAIAAAKKIGAKVSIPMHWGDIVGTEKDAREFAEGVNGAVIL